MVGEIIPEWWANQQTDPKKRETIRWVLRSELKEAMRDRTSQMP
jgi:hypothetical protein